MGWDVIALTSRSNRDASLYLKEFTNRQKAGLIAENTSLLAVPDPGGHAGQSVGSGGATLNALLTVTEYMSALVGHTVANPDVLLGAKVLIVHMSGKPFTTFAATTVTKDQHRELLYNVDFLLQTMDKLAEESPPGVWVCSSEMLLRLPLQDTSQWKITKPGVAVVTVPGNIEDAQVHGVFKLDSETNEVQDLIYCGSSDEIQSTVLPSSKVPLVSGIVYFCPSTAEKLIGLTITHPMNACTYLGADDGAESFPLSLFLDVIKCMCSGVSLDQVMEQTNVTNPLRTKARSVLWHKLQGVEVSAIITEGARFVYIPASLRGQAELHYPKSLINDAEGQPFENKNTWSRRTRAYIEGSMADGEGGCVVINSMTAPLVTAASSAVVCHCKLTNAWDIGKDAYLFGIEETKSDSILRRIEPGIAVREHRLLLTPATRHDSTQAITHVWTVLGVDDDVEDHDSLPGRVRSQRASPNKKAESVYVGTFCGQRWEAFFTRTGIDPSELWGPEVLVRSAATAKMFPAATAGANVGVSDVLWLQDSVPTASQLRSWRESWRLSYLTILNRSDRTADDAWRNELSFEIQNSILALTLTMPEMGEKGKELAAKSGLTDEDWCLLPYFSACAIDSNYRVLEVLDNVAKSTHSFGVAARTLACIADLLGHFSFGKGGLRSGPGRNNLFAHAFSLLEEGKISEGVTAMAKQRKHWLNSADALIRAARHYESAAQILIRRAVMTVSEIINVERTPNFKPTNKWIKVETAARMDISGGWTDTPPVTYEHGGAVVNAAVLVDGKRPIGAKVRRIDECKLVFVMGDQTIEVTDIAQVATYPQPQSPGALLKAGFCCAKLISLEFDGTLEEQLRSQHGGGFELHTWSNMPQGSGMGTSSILAGAVIAALWKCAGFDYTTADLVHSVCLLEQMLTTGGGWQDQVGGVYAGIKIGRSKAELPLFIETELIECSKDFVQTFNQHLVLIYTGKTRLARNLLQNVIRNWYARNPDLVANTDALTTTAEECRQAFIDQDLSKIGECLDAYWEQKKLMAPGCEPSFVRSMMDVMRPHTFGQAMAGAGGGGFMFVITKEPNASKKMEDLVRSHKIPGVDDVRFHEVEVDEIGILITEEDA
eukprot:m.209883 g.209883  ORF g.209883 m.209883 type:complete len:1113 (-) comp33054_c0_seq1:185-3523(-)